MRVRRALFIWLVWGASAKLARSRHRNRSKITETTFYLLIHFRIGGNLICPFAFPFVARCMVVRIAGRTRYPRYRLHRPCGATDPHLKFRDNGAGRPKMRALRADEIRIR